MSNVQQLEGHTLNPSMAPKITQWANEPTIQQLKDDWEASKPAHDTHVLNVKRWTDLSKIKGEARPVKVKGRSQVQPKVVRRQAEWRYSALTEPFLGSEKLFDVSPITFEDDLSAKQNELVLNWQFRTKINRVRFIDEYIRTNVDEGSAIIRVGWKRVIKKVMETVPVWTYLEPQGQEDVDALEQAIAYKMENPREYEEETPPAIKASVDYWEENQVPNTAVQTGEQQVEVDKIVWNAPTLDIVNPANFYVDPSCGNDLDKAGFICITFETSLAEVKKDGRYKNLEFVNWEGASILASPDHESKTPDTFNFKDKLRKKAVAYEYWGFWDINGDGDLQPIVATWIGDTLVRMEENPFPDGKLPFIITNYMPIIRELMGEPDAELLEDNQKILGAITRGMIDLMGRSANAQQGMPKGMLDVVNKRRFESGQDYEYNPNMNPQIGLVEHKYPEIPNSAMNMLMLQNQEAEALTGVKSFSGGLSGEAYGDVAAGIRGALDAASKREMAILRRMAKGLCDIGTKIAAMNAVFLSEKEIVRVTNTQFVEINREDLAGNYDLEVDISTAEIDNNKAQDLGFMLQTIGNNMDFGITQIILCEIAELKRMPALAQKIKSFQPQPDPIQQKLQELAVLKAEKEIALLDSEIALNTAKANEADQRADQIDLETVEQETGTKHERELEHMRAQATGNQDLEVTKALVKSRKKSDGGETDPEIEAAVGFNQLSKGNGQPRRALTNDIQGIGSALERDGFAQADPRLSVNSQYFDPRLDPALNPALSI